MSDRIFVACTPRTGNLWIRSMVARTLDLPPLAVNNPGEVDWEALPERCLVAMHWRYSRAFEDFLRQRRFKILVVARHPLDVMVSILHFAEEGLTARWLEGECGNEDALKGLSPDSPAFADYCLSPRAETLLGISTDWMPAADAVIRYEDAQASPVEAVRRVVEALGGSIQEPVAAIGLAEMRRVAGRHVWRGQPGGWRALVTPELALRVHARHRKHFEAFGFDCDPDPALDAAQAHRNWLDITQTDSGSAQVAPLPVRADHGGVAEIDLGAIRREVAAIQWFHSIDLGHGIVTPGHDIDSKAKIAFNAIPEDLSGKTVLDVGAWDGLFSFEAEKRGASRVLATDSFIWSGAGWGSKAGFELARRVLRSRVEDLHIDVMDLDPGRVGMFDTVFFLGVLYHLRHPLLAIEKVAAVTRERLILSTWADLATLDRPAAAFYPTVELAGDRTNWWGLNPQCLRAMLEDVGFTHIEVVSPAPAGLRSEQPFPMAVHAWK